MRYALMALWLLLCPPALADVSVGVRVAIPGLSIGINMPTYPTLVRVPNYPVYYDPQVNANYFFYDGLFWVFAGDTWYASTWYDGPWEAVAPDAVPYFILRIPVRYYREPPSFFHLNDSEGEMGSNKDRHTLIGEGQIGVEAFRELVKDPRSQNIPLILETPQLNYEIGEDDVTPDPYDVRMMELLASLSR